MNHKHHKKGQMEMFGLIIIVIMISIGFFMYIAFKGKEKPNNFQQDFINEELPKNYVNSIVNVNIAECPSYTINDLIKDCATGRTINCAAQDSCTVLNRTLTFITNRTLMREDRAFHLYTEGINWPTQGQSISMINRNCTKANYRTVQTGTSYVPVWPNPIGTVFLHLEICSR